MLREYNQSKEGVKIPENVVLKTMGKNICKKNTANNSSSVRTRQNRLVLVLLVVWENQSSLKIKKLVDYWAIRDHNSIK